MGKSSRKKRTRDAASTLAPPSPVPSRWRLVGVDELWARFIAPVPIERLAWLRIFIPLAVLGFMSGRLVHADDWLGVAGFQVPDLGGSWKQPLYLPPLPDVLAWVVAGATLLSGLMTAVGAFTRTSSAVFGACLCYVALADRLAAFTVSKFGAVLVVALAFTTAGARYSFDAWREARRLRRAGRDLHPPTHVSWGQVRFFQAALVVLYSASGIAKANVDWLEHDHVIWTHLHSSYQTPFAHWFANFMPAWTWAPTQYATLFYEVFAPILFAVTFIRPVAIAYGVAMHLLIGLLFGPVIWFALLMISLILGGFLPVRWLARALAPLDAYREPAPPPEPAPVGSP